jgi:hypothetical protein
MPIAYVALSTFVPKPKNRSHFFFRLFWSFFSFLGVFVPSYSDVGYLFARLLVCVFPVCQGGAWFLPG